MKQTSDPIVQKCNCKDFFGLQDRSFTAKTHNAILSANIGYTRGLL